MATDWYYSVGGEQGGPVAWDDLKRLAVERKLAGGDLVWSEGMPEWVEARSVADLMPAKGPPPLPRKTAPAAPSALALAPKDEKRVTGELHFVGKGGGNPGGLIGLKEQLAVFLDKERIGTGSYVDGFRLQFESVVGSHSVTIKEEKQVGGVAKLMTAGVNLGLEKTYRVTFKEPGHYEVEFLPPSGFKAKLGLEKLPADAEVAHTGPALRSTAVSEERTTALVGLWQDVGGSGLGFLFTPDSAMVRDDGLASKFRWIGRDAIELYAEGCDATVVFHILSLGSHELVLKAGEAAGHFKRGLTITQVEMQRREAEARQRQAETAQTFRDAAVGVSSLLAAGGFAVLCGGVGVGAAAAGIGIGVGAAGGVRGEAGGGTPGPTYNQEPCDVCSQRGWTPGTRGDGTKITCTICGGKGFVLRKSK